MMQPTSVSYHTQRQMGTATIGAYNTLDAAFCAFNERFFEGTLPRVAITLQRKKNAYGYFHDKKFGNVSGERIAEIALNPDHFIARDDKDVLSTLLHEMCHLWQFTFGKPSRKTYHNIEFAQVMEKCGLICSATGAPGGRKTGQKMTHYIAPGGAFELALDEMDMTGITDWASLPDVQGESKPKSESKVKFTCPMCEKNAWAKPTARLICGECEEKMESEQ